MKSVFVSLFALSLLVSTGSSQWKKNGKSEADSIDRKSVSGFGAHLVVIRNPRSFVQEWLKSATPKIESGQNLKSGEPLGIIVFFTGCKTDDLGVCNSIVDYTIYKPDGSIYAERKNQPLWKEIAPPPPDIQLGRAILVFQMKENDPTGEYKVRAKVSDMNRQVSLDLETMFQLK